MTAGVGQAVARLDAWLESMRGPQGYTGPVMHWWESNFLYTGALLDWRYEGIIDGYRELYLRTRQDVFLERALTAADDLLSQQRPDGQWPRSSFQFGPVAGGTPHEAALDSALLHLAVTLRDLGREYQPLVQAAQHNIEGYWIAQLWNGKGFQDQPYNSVFVANKHATLLEALLLAETLTGADYGEYMARCADVILYSQQEGGPQDGGTVHLGIGPSRLAIPIYTARTMNGLLSYHDRHPDPKLAHALAQAAKFLVRLLTPDGEEWGIYGDGRKARNPVMVAGAGDVLRYFLRVQERGLADVQHAITRLTTTLLEAQSPSGAIPTALGFAAKGLSHAPRQRDLRDVLPVVGWVDKTFRALAMSLPEGERVPQGIVRAHQENVFWRGQSVTLEELPHALEVRDARHRPLYQWIKGESSPRVYDL